MLLISAGSKAKFLIIEPILFRNNLVALAISLLYALFAVVNQGDFERDFPVLVNSAHRDKVTAFTRGFFDAGDWAILV